jgi:hypothetical protein
MSASVRGASPAASPQAPHTPTAPPACSAPLPTCMRGWVGGLARTRHDDTNACSYAMRVVCTCRTAVRNSFSANRALGEFACVAQARARSAHQRPRLLFAACSMPSPADHPYGPLTHMRSVRAGTPRGARGLVRNTHLGNLFVRPRLDRSLIVECHRLSLGRLGHVQLACLHACP